MNYRLFIERQAQKALARVERSERDRLVEAIRGLEGDPRPPGTKKLSGRDAWRIRVGSYRVIYEIRDDLLLILVVHVGHRRDVYRR